jgi:hypothetical protein
MKLTPEQKAANKLARQEERQELKRIARIEAGKNQKPVNKLTITIEWKKSRMWGHNPHMQAKCEHKDGTITYYNSTASGCGYDKESQVIADAFNELLKYKLYKLEAEPLENIPYGMETKRYKAYSGGIGVNCYYKISEAIGGKFEQIASGKTFDAYTYTDLN